MAPLEGSTKELDEKYVDSIVKFVSEVRNGKLQGSNKIASETITLLEQIINDSQNASALELSLSVREVGRRLVRALPHELVCANMVRRVLRAIRDETRITAHQTGDGGGESLQRLVQAAPARRATLGAQPHDLREPLRDHIAELRTELETSTSAICSTAREHVHAVVLSANSREKSKIGEFDTQKFDRDIEMDLLGLISESSPDELILSAGASALVERFLRGCVARRYRLLLAETSRDVHESHAMAARLSAAGVAVTVVSNASVYAVMSRVNKVVLGVQAALAGGALLAAAGAHAVTLAAKHYSVPVIALCPLYALSPLHARDPRTYNALAAPAQALSYASETADATHVIAPLFDLIPPDHVTLFITNLGGSSPSYIYRLLSELYDPNDYHI